MMGTPDRMTLGSFKLASPCTEGVPCRRKPTAVEPVAPCAFYARSLPPFPFPAWLLEFLTRPGSCSLVWPHLPLGVDPSLRKRRCGAAAAQGKGGARGARPRPVPGRAGRRRALCERALHSGNAEERGRSREREGRQGRPWTAGAGQREERARTGLLVEQPLQGWGVPPGVHPVRRGGAGGTGGARRPRSVGL